MDYEQRMRLRGRLQRMGNGALIEEVIRLGEEVDLLTARLTALESATRSSERGESVFADTSGDLDGFDPSKSS